MAALSGPVDREHLEAGLEALRGLGFEPVPAPNLKRNWELFAGTDEERLEGFHVLATDPSLRAIFFARGGSGLLRLLPSVDWVLLAKYPRAYVGYSDLTPFLGQVVARLGLAAFHGPMVASDLARGLTGEEVWSLMSALAGEPMILPAEGSLKEGEARGVVLGGCLSLLTSTLGTPYAADLESSLVFLEDVNEAPYRLDRMLTQLRLSGTLSDTQGLIFGQMSGIPGERPGWLEAMVDDQNGPVVYGVSSGHGKPNLTIPLGLSASLDAASLELRFE